MSNLRAAAPVTEAELQAAAGVRVLFGHKSVGANVLSGISSLFDRAGVTWPIVDARGPLEAESSFLAHAQVGRNRDPHGKLSDFTALVDGPAGERVEIALVKLCYADVDSTTEVEPLFERYAKVMDGLAVRHPELKLAYCTVPLTTDRSWKAKVKATIGTADRRGPADNLARHRYNTLVRERYAPTGRLFDIAAVEATLAERPMLRRLDGQEYHVLNRALSSDAGHLNAAGSLAAATELVRVIAASAA